MFLPIRTDCPLRSRPWVNWGLLAANCLVFLAQCLTHQFDRVTGLFELNSRVPELSRFVTYAFVHADWVHLLVNMLALYIFGNNINDRMGHLGYLAFYLAGAIIAGIGFVLTESTGVGVLGASGAVFAVMGAYLALHPRSNITVLSLLLLGTFEVPSMYVIFVFFVIDLIGQIAGNTGVAHVAHITGLLFGFWVCLGLLSLTLLPRDPFDFLALLQRWHRRRQYKELVRQGYNPFAYVARPAGQRGHPARPQPAAPAPDPNLYRIRDLRAEINEAVAHHNLPHAAILFLELRQLDPRQVLSRQAQLDVANQLASQQFYPEAADAYENFLRHYPKFQQIEQVQLMLGIIYARYLRRPERTQGLLLDALRRLHASRDIAMAQAELTRLEPLLKSHRQP